MEKVKAYLQKIDAVIDEGKFKDNWESLSQFKMPTWYGERRFGIFIHWGVYSVPAFFNEWYPREMYSKDSLSAAHHNKTYGRTVEYRDFIAQFKPQKFNAEEWVQLFKDSGAGYIMPVAEHHDGVKMYASDLNHWNMLELNGRDYMQELHDACDKLDMGFCMSNHRAEHYWFFNTARKDYPNSEISKNQYPDLYGPAYLPPSGNVAKTDKEITATPEFMEEWLATACEMIDRNQPLAVYFDWWVQKDEFRPYLKKFVAYYYNRGLEWGKEVAVFFKWGALFDGCGIFDVERGQIDGVARELWQNDTSISKKAWGYVKPNAYKTPGNILRNMIEVFSKNGCYMLNVGPKADGTICDEEKAVLREIGKWLKVNGEAVYGSKPFEVCPFEGKKSKNGAFQENKKFRKNEYCFTAKPGKIYVFPMCEKLKSTLTVKSLRRANEGGIRYKVEKISVLGEGKSLPFTQTEEKMEIELGTPRDNTIPICLCVEVE